MYFYLNADDIDPTPDYKKIVPSVGLGYVGARSFLKVKQACDKRVPVAETVLQFMDIENEEWDFPRCVPRIRQGFRADRREPLDQFLARHRDAEAEVLYGHASVDVPKA